MTTPEDRIVWEADEEALYRSAHEAGHLPPGGVSDTFVRPCLVCGITVHVVDGREWDHLHHVFEADESLAAFAWWQGHDSADAELEQARAENERLRLDVSHRSATVAWQQRRAEAAESALTEAREQIERLRELAEKWVTEVESGYTGRETYHFMAWSLLTALTGEYPPAGVNFRAVLADVPPAAQGDTGDAPPAEQEAGEDRG